MLNASLQAQTEQRVGSEDTRRIAQGTEQRPIQPRQIPQLATKRGQERVERQWRGVTYGVEAKASLYLMIPRYQLGYLSRSDEEQRGAASQCSLGHITVRLIAEEDKVENKIGEVEEHVLVTPHDNLQCERDAV